MLTVSALSYLRTLNFSFFLITLAPSVAPSVPVVTDPNWKAGAGYMGGFSPAGVGAGARKDKGAGGVFSPAEGWAGEGAVGSSSPALLEGAAVGALLADSTAGGTTTAIVSTASLGGSPWVATGAVRLSRATHASRRAQYSTQSASAATAARRPAA